MKPVERENKVGRNFKPFGSKRLHQKYNPHGIKLYNKYGCLSCQNDLLDSYGTDNLNDEVNSKERSWSIPHDYTNNKCNSDRTVNHSQKKADQTIYKKLHGPKNINLTQKKRKNI